MKKILWVFILYLLLINTTFWYELSSSDLKSLVIYKSKIIKNLEKNPNRVFSLKSKLDIILKTYPKNTKNHVILNNIYDFINEYILTYENNILKQKKQIDEQLKIDEINKNLELSKLNDIKKKENLELLKKDTSIISNFIIEPKYDHLYLKNIYLENIGSLWDITGIFEHIYLVNNENHIFANGYVINNYIYFDLKNEILLEKNNLNKLYIKVVLSDFKNKSGEIKLKLSTPNNAPIWTYNWIRAIWYSNWSYINSEVNILNPIITFITKTASFISKKENFNPSYNILDEFTINNNWQNNLEIKSFDFQLYGSFLDSLDYNTKFILKIKWTNQEFWSANLFNLQNNILTINYTWNSLNYISKNSFTDYYLEIEHIWNPIWSREVRLNNVVIWDLKWDFITNLNTYSNIWLPLKYSVYRY